jgi:hypothetical protein
LKHKIEVFAWRSIMLMLVMLTHTVLSEQGLSSLLCSALQALSNLDLLNPGGVEATAAAERYNLYKYY